MSWGRDAAAVALETGVTPIAEGMISDPDTQGHGNNAGDSGDDVMRFAQLSEFGDGGDDDDDDNNATGIGLQVLKQRKRVRSLSIDTTTHMLGTPDPDTDRLLDGPHLAKRQRPYLCTNDKSVPKHTLTPNPQSTRAPEAGTGGTRSRMDDGCIGSGYNGDAVVIGSETTRVTTERPTTETVTTLATMLVMSGPPSTPSTLNTLRPLSNQHRPSGNRPAISTELNAYVRLRSCVIALAVVVWPTMTTDHGRLREHIRSAR